MPLLECERLARSIEELADDRQPKLAGRQRQHLNRFLQRDENRWVRWQVGRDRESLPGDRELSQGLVRNALVIDRLRAET